MRPAAQVAIGGETMGKTSGEQNTSIPGADVNGAGEDKTNGVAPAATVLIKDNVESSAKVTPAQFNPPAAPTDAADLTAILPQVTKIVSRSLKAARPSAPA
jgi:hypothetical protein